MTNLFKKYLERRERKRHKVEFYKLQTIGSPIFPLPREMRRVARSLEGKVITLGEAIKTIKSSARKEGGKIKIFYEKGEGKIIFKSNYGIFANFYPLLGYREVEDSGELNGR